MRVLVFGPTGQLGTDVVRVFMGRGEDVLPVTRELADVDGSNRSPGSAGS